MQDLGIKPKSFDPTRFGLFRLELQLNIRNKRNADLGVKPKSLIYHAHTKFDLFTNLTNNWKLRFGTSGRGDACLGAGD